MTDTIHELIKNTPPAATALSAPGRADLTYGGLLDQAQAVVQTLNARGIGRGDRVAIVLPNGPEMASAFLGVGAGTATAPLNPAYRADEFDFYLTDLNAKALLVERGSQSPARAVAAEHGIPVMEIAWDESDPAGAFSLPEADGSGATAPGMARPEDMALVLHTSGTTSRPKIVPLAQANVCASSAHIVESLRLAPEDRCLNTMPLFHIHGLIAAVLSSVRAGASVYCTPGFNALSFFSWLAEARPSWYTAVPTMHQIILDRAPRNAEIVAAANLRFIRSSSASLPPQIMARLEETFGCPVIEAYGMTEAAHQMAANPLPDAVRKAGTVGLAAGPEIAIMSEGGEILNTGETGEIVIRGRNVFSGYEANPTANAEAFTDGWFRTGDQGFQDAGGYLTISGRLKEIINRGGEKVSPREVDEILLDHPAVAQAVTFAMPHEKLGEDVAAAIVTEDGQEVTEREVRDFAAKSLADFKVPRKVVFLDEIPKGATGKVQRIGLAEKLGLG
jgi:acyl-CoA synthetase (AMP-forming)/AMP-acid ligase II